MQQGKLAGLGAGVVGVGRALTGVYFMAGPVDGARMWVGDDSDASVAIARPTSMISPAIRRWALG